MKGHEPVLAMRRGGKRPLHVTLSNVAAAASEHWSQHHELAPFPDVTVEPNDCPELLDLRFVVGLPVLVDIGPDVERMKRLVLACEQAGASRVYGFARIDKNINVSTVLAAICTEGEDQSWRN